MRGRAAASTALTSLLPVKMSVVFVTFVRSGPLLYGKKTPGVPGIVPVKRHRGEPGHTRDTHGTHGRTRAHGHTDHTDEPLTTTTIQTHQPTAVDRNWSTGTSRILLQGKLQGWVRCIAGGGLF
jgi:hypothetical protein